MDDDQTVLIQMEYVGGKSNHRLVRNFPVKLCGSLAVPRSNGKSNGEADKTDCSRGEGKDGRCERRGGRLENGTISAPPMATLLASSGSCLIIISW